TPEYMSPEQAMGHATDARSDLYGVGMLLYEMLAGKSPFNAEEVTEMLRAQIQDPPPPLPEHIPERLRNAVVWLLSKDPDARPESAEELSGEFLGVAEELEYSPHQPRGGSRRDSSRSKASDYTGPSLPSSVVAARFSLIPSQIRKRVPLWIPLGA